MSENTAKRAEDLAAQLKERFGAAVPTSQAAALLLEYAQSLRASSAGAVPTDDKIRDLYHQETGFLLDESPADLLGFARALLASAPTPPAASASAEGGKGVDQIFAANKVVAEQWGVPEMTPFVRLCDQETWRRMVDDYAVERGEGKLWLWRNFVDGKPEYWAFDNPFPVHMDGGDPQTLGEPCGYALFKPSRPGRADFSEDEVLRRVAAAALSTPPSADRGGDEREAFEAWAQECRLPTHRVKSGDYAASRTAWAWHAWQARSALAAKPEAQVQGEVDADGEAFRAAARLGLTLRFYGGCAQSGMPGGPSAYEVVSGGDRATAMRQAVRLAADVMSRGGEAQRLTTPPAAQQAEQPAQGDCPHAAPFRYCPTCPVSPCPVGLGGSK